MVDNDDPELLFDTPFDDRAQFEAEAGGYLSNVYVKLTDDTKYPVVFYDCVRLAQMLEYEASVGRMCVADAGMIVMPEVTLTNIKTAVKRLSEEGYFDSFRPI